jgi:hypothetical protein
MPVTAPGGEGVLVIGSGVMVGAKVGVDVGICVGVDEGVKVGVDVGICVGGGEGVTVGPNACPGPQPEVNIRMIRLEIIGMLRFISTPLIHSKSKEIRRHCT